MRAVLTRVKHASVTIDGKVHARIGEGCIGQEALARVVNHPALKNLPFCLETPNELPGYAKEIALMRSLAE